MISVPLWMLILNIAIILIQIGGFSKVIYNDLVHVQKALDKIETHVENITKEFSTINSTVSGIKARCEERHFTKIKVRKTK